MWMVANAPKRAPSGQPRSRPDLAHKGGSVARRLPKVLTGEQVVQLLKRPNLNAPTGLRNRCMLELMLRCGLRVAECCGVYLRDVDWDTGEIHIRPEVAKGGREAVAYMDEQSQELLERWKPVRRRYAAGAPFLFTTLKGTPVGHKYVWEMVSRYARRAGIERHVHPHMLRHTFATELLREGFNLREVQALMRHSNISTTSIYLHVIDVDLQRKVRARRR